MLLMTFRMCKILLKSPQLMVTCRCDRAFEIKFVLTLSFLTLALNMVSSPRPCPRFQVLVLEHKVLDNITAMSSIMLHAGACNGMWEESTQLQQQ